MRRGQLVLAQTEASRGRTTIVSEMAALSAKGADKSELVTYQAASTDQVELISAPGETVISSSQRLLVGVGVGLLAGFALLVLMELLGARA